MRSRSSFHFYRTLHLAWPAVISQASHMIVTFCDTVIVGRMGENELGTASLSTSIASVFLVFCLGFSFPISALVAQSVGERNEEKTNRLFKHGILLSTAIGIGIAALGISLLPLISYLDQPAAVVENTPVFFTNLMLSLIPLMIYQGLRQFIEGLGDTRPAMVVGLITILLNIGANYLFIYGWGPVPAFGVGGSGMATNVARWFLALGLGWYVFTRPKYRAYVITWKQVKVTLTEMSAIFKLGLPISMQLVFEVAVFGTAAIMMGWISPQAMAAHQSVLTLAGLTYMAASGIGTATTIRAGNYFGARDLQQLKAATNMSLKMVMAFMGLMALGMVVFNKELPQLFVNQENTILLASELLWLAALFQIADGSQAVILGALRGINDVKYPTLITLTAYWVIAMPLGYVMAFKLDYGALGIWVGLAAGLFFAFAVLWARLNYRINYLKRNRDRLELLASETVIAH